jgi:thioredoxin-like negative regulator of GroEL
LKKSPEPTVPASPADPVGTISRMRSAMARGDWASAIAAAEAWRQAGGHDWRVNLNLAVCRSRARQGREADWLTLIQEALSASNHATPAVLGAAEVLGVTGHWEQALGLLAALERRCPQPLPWQALQLRSGMLARLGNVPAGLAALASWPAPARDWRWRMAKADVHVQAGQWRDAEALYRAVLSERPGQAEAHLNLALTLLSQRRCLEAWPHYEWRQGNPRLDAGGVPRRLPALDALAERDVVVIGEQGVGDQVMASRYLRPLAALCRSLSVAPAPRLASLLRRSLPNAVTVVESGAAPPPGTEVIGMASLPLLFWPDLGQAPVESLGYLRPDPQRVEAWRARLSGCPARLQLGIGWLGGVTGAERRERALAPSDLQALGRWPETQWVDLQFLPPDSADLAAVSTGVGFHRLGEPGADLDDTLALIQCLDGVITTRQTVAHLAGAVGCRGQVLVPARPEWRYWGDNNRWVWYPSLELLQQHQRGDWQPALGELARRWSVATHT